MQTEQPTPEHDSPNERDAAHVDEAPKKYRKIARVEIAATGRGWNVILDDGSHLGGWQRVEVVGDAREVTMLAIVLPAHRVAFGSDVLRGPVFREYPEDVETTAKERPPRVGVRDFASPECAALFDAMRADR